MKKILSKLLVLSMCLSLIGCATQEESTQQSDVDNKIESTETSYPRTIVDAKGNEVVLESKPEKVALLHVSFLEHLLVLDETPIAVAAGNAYGQTEALSNSELLGEYMKKADIIDLGSAATINPEAVLEAEPDLILSFNTTLYDEIYDQLTAIAPVILLDSTKHWIEELEEVAEIFDKADEVSAIIKEINAEIEETKDFVSDYKDETVAIFRTNGTNFIGIAQSEYYDELGLTEPINWPVGYAPFSIEVVVEMNPTYIVFQHNYDASVAFVESLGSISAWNELDAVKNGEIYYFDENINTFGPLAMKLSAQKIKELYSR